MRDPSDCGLDDRSLDGPGAGLRAEEYGAYEDVDARERDAAEPPERPTIGGRRMSLAVRTGYREFESPSFGLLVLIVRVIVGGDAGGGALGCEEGAQPEQRRLCAGAGRQGIWNAPGRSSPYCAPWGPSQSEPSLPR